MEYRLARPRPAARAVATAASIVAVATVGTVLAVLDHGAPTTVATFGTPPPGATTPFDRPERAPLGAAPRATAATSTVPPSTAPAATVPAALRASATTTAPSAPATTAPPPDPSTSLPSEPIAPPSDPRAEEELIELGTISIPSLGVHAPLHEGIRLSTLDRGPGHWPGTAMPGEVGNVVVAAHRTSHGGPFRHIDQLVAGDTVEFTTDAGTSIYEVTGTQVVEPEAIWIVDPTDTPTATLFACHPPGSVSQRIVVDLELVP